MMNLPEIVSSGNTKGLKKRELPVRAPWQIGGGGDTDDWKPARCRPTSLEQAKHKYEGLVRARDEIRKTDIAKKIFRDRIRRKPVVTYPSEDDVVQRVESPFAVMELDLLESYYCRPPKVSPSLMELLDKYYEPINREFYPSYLELPTVRTEPIVKLTETAQSILKSRREKKEKRTLKAKKEDISNLISMRIKGLKRLRINKLMLARGPTFIVPNHLVNSWNPLQFIQEHRSRVFSVSDASSVANPTDLSVDLDLSVDYNKLL